MVFSLKCDLNFVQKVGQLIPTWKYLILLVDLRLSGDKLLEADVISIEGLIKVDNDLLVNTNGFFPLALGKFAKDDIVFHLVAKSA